MKLTKHELAAGVFALVILLTLILLPMPAGAATQRYCYRTAKGVVCVQAGQSPSGGSGITPVKRYKPGNANQPAGGTGITPVRR